MVAISSVSIYTLSQFFLFFLFAYYVILLLFRDWCLSRQIWWGHKFPFFETEHGWVAARSVEDARQKGEKKFEKTCTKIIQENDVIDTWFSSALLPFSVFGWPNSVRKFHFYVNIKFVI